MEIIVKAKLQGILEAYNIFIDDEKVAKIRGDKVTTLKVSDEEHTLQLKSANGKSSLIKIDKPQKENDILYLNFITHYSRAFKEGYFELVEE